MDDIIQEYSCNEACKSEPLTEIPDRMLGGPVE